MAELVVAVDVGTGSARAGVFRRRRPHARPRRAPDRAARTGARACAEQDSEDIWAAAGAAVRAARAEAGAAADAVAGLGFDATCSLVLRDRAGQPLAASGDAGERWDTMLWLDHRARAEAEAVTATGHAGPDPRSAA